MVDVLLGLQWGDEGKGKVVDFFAKNYQVVARFQGGPNAGHTLYYNKKKIVLHHLPSGVLSEDTFNLIGNGVVLDPIIFKNECQSIQDIIGEDFKKRIFLSNRCNIILPTHIALDSASEKIKGKEKIGSTLKGIAPAYMDKTGRNALRLGDILQPDFKEKYNKLKDKHVHLLEYYGYQEDISEAEKKFFEGIEFLKTLKIGNSTYFIHDMISQDKIVLAEGAQGTLLDLDHGSYPFVTSSSTTIGGVCAGLGVNASQIRNVIGITKAYSTRVGSGPFPTELLDADGEKLRKVGNEFGSTTGRPRRCGWLDLVALRYACMINGVKNLIITKLDILDDFDEIKICTSYKYQNKEYGKFLFNLGHETFEPVYKTLPGWKTKTSDLTSFKQLPKEMQELIRHLNSDIKTFITYASIGPGRDQMVRVM